MIFFWDFFALIFLQLPKLLLAQLWKKVPTCRLSLPSDRLFVTFKTTFLSPRAHLVWPFHTLMSSDQIWCSNNSFEPCLYLDFSYKTLQFSGRKTRPDAGQLPVQCSVFYKPAKNGKAYFREDMTSVPTERVSWETCWSRVGGKYYLSSWSKEHKVGLL